MPGDAGDRASTYRHLFNRQLPEQHSPSCEQRDDLGLHETSKQPLVSYTHVEALQARVPASKPRLVQEAASGTPASHCSVPSTTPSPHAGVQSAAQPAWFSEGSQTSSPQKPQSGQQVVTLSLPVQSPSPQLCGQSPGQLSAS